MLEQAEQIHAPRKPRGEHELLGLHGISGGRVAQRVVSGKVEAQVVAVVLEGEDFDARSEACEFCAGRHAAVVQRFALVDVVGALAPKVYFLAGHPVDFAHNGEVATEEAVALSGAVHEVERKSHVAQVQAVAEGNVVEEFPGLVFHHVHGVDGFPTAVLAVPHKVVGVNIIGTCAEGALTYLRRQLVVIAQVVTHACSKGIRGDVGAETREVIDVDGREVVFKSADADNLLTAREAPTVLGVGEVKPVGSVEVAHVLVGLVEALAVRVSDVLTNLSVEADVEKLAFEARFGIILGAIVVEVLVIAACFKAQGVELMGLREEGGAREEEKEQRENLFHKEGDDEVIVRFPATPSQGIVRADTTYPLREGAVW